MTIADRVSETCTLSGTADVLLTGATGGTVQAFSDAYAGGETDIPYLILAPDASQWETGRGAFTAPNQLARSTVTDSSAGGSKVNFKAGGAKTCVVVVSAGQAMIQSENLSELDSPATARGNLGATSVGDDVFTAASQAAARTATGATSVGAAVYTAASEASARTAILCPARTDATLFGDTRLREDGGLRPRILLSNNVGTTVFTVDVVDVSGTDVFRIHRVSTADSLTIDGANGNTGFGTNGPLGKIDVNGTIFQRGAVLHADPPVDVLRAGNGPELEDFVHDMFALGRLPTMAERVLMPRIDPVNGNPMEGAEVPMDEVHEIGDKARSLEAAMETMLDYIGQLHQRILVLEGDTRTIPKPQKGTPPKNPRAFPPDGAP